MTTRRKGKRVAGKQGAADGAVERRAALADAASAARASNDPADLEAVARVAAAVGDADLAIALATEVERALDEPWSHAALAAVHGRLGRRAEVDRLRARVGDATDEQSLLSLALAYEDLGDEVTADTFLTRIESPEVALAVIAVAAARRGAFERATSLLGQKPLATADARPILISALRDVAVLAGAAGATAERRRAADLLDRAEKAIAKLDRSAIPDELAKLAIVHAAVGARKEARRIARDADERARKGARGAGAAGEAWRPTLARALHLAGDDAAARRVLDAYVAEMAYGQSAWRHALGAVASALAGARDDAESWIRSAEKLLGDQPSADDATTTRARLAEALLALSDVGGALAQAREIPAANVKLRTLLAVATPPGEPPGLQ